MRLNQIKLAGFKSFVDPTNLSVPGDLVGVVGPNGCGKSNIIDAVRWVLGESRASALRGDSMQDVIFNGSTLRKPVARASVELIFDNSLGRAAGQWSQYAEISVKRVLTRDGDSSYLINNTQVRRRDIHDIFLGTGLGPRAYAIIEQGMISRIIEAKPEELRVFLEEAAGVSKYKERRRETENRLADTRENLARVSDIREELGTQIEKLRRQAEIARQFNELSAVRQHKQHLLWALKRQESDVEAQRHVRDIDRLGIQLEEVTARIREIERFLESARDEHYAAGDALTVSQGELFAGNSEVARLEGEIRHVGELRQRLGSDLAQYSAQVEINTKRSGELGEAKQLWSRRLEEMKARGDTARLRAAEELARLPQMEEASKSAQLATAAARDALTATEHAVRMEQTHLAHSEKVTQGLLTRDQRLSQEIDGLEVTDRTAIAALEGEIGRAIAMESEKQRRVRELDTIRLELDHRLQESIEILQSQEKSLSARTARLDVLQQVQQRLDSNGAIQGWMNERGLDRCSRLWQGFQVENGWESAVEAVLRERLHALRADDPAGLQAMASLSPPSSLTLFSSGESKATEQIPGLRELRDLITVTDAAIDPAISDWLQSHYVVDGVPGIETRSQLPAGVVLVNREGHQFSRFAISFCAPDAPDSGMLARQRDIEALQSEIRLLRHDVAAANAKVADLRVQLSAQASGLAIMRGECADLFKLIHERQVQLLKLSQAAEKTHIRLEQINAERADIGLATTAESDVSCAIAAQLSALTQELSMKRDAVARSKDALGEAESTLAKQRQLLPLAEREAQEAGYSEKESHAKIEELQRSIENVTEQLQAAQQSIEKLSRDLLGLDDTELQALLQVALENRVLREQVLGESRHRQEQAASQLRSSEEGRVTEDQKLEPLRDRLAELRLKEQAARINVQQFSAFLEEAGLDEAGIQQLFQSVPEKQKAGPIQSEIARLTSDIAALGPINMAALDELATSTERKDFLDSQANDLSLALDTLENAIRRIDRETRELMQQTFDAVNEHFGKLFPLLFGGGEARLVMTGEEILDSGVQVVARPPGKKNSTIHLLSGGEKAMTAISLVFSFFQLNPAPFCLLDEVDAPLDDANTGRFCELVKKMSQSTQFLYISHNKLTMEMASHLVGVTMQEQGVSRVVAVDIDEALQLREPVAA